MLAIRPSILFFRDILHTVVRSVISTRPAFRLIIIRRGGKGRRERKRTRKRDGERKEEGIRGAIAVSATIGNFIGHRSSCNAMGLANVSGLPTNSALRLARAKCEKIFGGNAQCLSSEMIYRNDVLFFFLSHFPFLHRRRPRAPIREF